MGEMQSSRLASVLEWRCLCSVRRAVACESTPSRFSHFSVSDLLAVFLASVSASRVPTRHYRTGSEAGAVAYPHIIASWRYGWRDWPDRLFCSGSFGVPVAQDTDSNTRARKHRDAPQCGAVLVDRGHAATAQSVKSRTAFAATRFVRARKITRATRTEPRCIA